MLRTGSFLAAFLLGFLPAVDGIRPGGGFAAPSAGAWAPLREEVPRALEPRTPAGMGEPGAVLRAAARSGRGKGRSLPREIRGEKGAPMRLVPAGWFLMGSNEGVLDSTPRRRVYLDAFYIDKYPVTNRQFGEWEDYGPGFRGARHPVVGVTWFLARDYCRSFSKRLPAEAEWEKAARGTDGRAYPWGNDWDGTKLLWQLNSRRRTHPVNRDYYTHASPYGAVDMAGHVWEWVADRYAADYYRRAPARNPKGPRRGVERVLRGGSWALRVKKFFRTFHRTAAFPTVRRSDAGFRCAKDVP